MWDIVLLVAAALILNLVTNFNASIFGSSLSFCPSVFTGGCMYMYVCMYACMFV